jgi:murein DD-endopeptidase MepM/ murein hydrolase activator NlpD
MYCHLNSFNVSKDDAMHMGEEIGRGGTTGNSTADHLHFMVIDPNKGLNGYVYPKVVDPLPYLPKPYTFK